MLHPEYGTTAMPLSSLPPISEILSSPHVKPWIDRLHPATVVSTVRSVLDELGHEAKQMATEKRLPDVADLTQRIVSRLKDLDAKDGDSPAVPVSMENLRNRASRLIPQLTAAPTIAAVCAVESETRCECGASTLSTVQLRLTPQSCSPGDLAAMLQQKTLEIEVHMDDGWIDLDLRKIDPKWDMVIVDTFLGD